MIRTLCMTLILSLPSALAAQARPAPPTLVRMESGSCARCTMTLRYVATVGSANDKELINDTGTLLALPSGEFLVWGEGPILRYAADGHFLGTVGRIGDGPGEYRWQQSVVAARGDSVSIFSYGKVTTISVASGAGRTVQAGQQLSAFRHLVLPNGDVLIQNYNAPTPPFVVLGPDAAVKSTFGPPATIVTKPTNRQGPDYDSQQYLVAAASGDAFWAAPQFYRHGLQRWSASGGKLQAITRTPNWFPTHDYAALTEARRRGGGVTPPLPFAVALWSDPGGRLFLFARTADAQWKPDPNASKLAELPAGRGERRAAPWVPTGGLGRYYDAIFDVYDAGTGSSLGAWRADDWITAAIGNGMLATQVESTDGVVSFHVWRVGFTGP
jgi:hypothetical protein